MVTLIAVLCPVFPLNQNRSASQLRSMCLQSQQSCRVSRAAWSLSDSDLLAWFLLAYLPCQLFDRGRSMSALTKLEYERDTNCVEISLFAQCKALISEGMSALRSIN